MGISEDCLYLNIFKPTTVVTPLPVLVFYHGGGSLYGGSGQGVPHLYNGTNLINAAPSGSKVIVVTVNYRLGVFGCLYLQSLVDEDINKQYNTGGVQNSIDVQQSLKWIQNNIGVCVCVYVLFVC